MKKNILLFCVFLLSGLCRLYADNGMIPDHLNQIKNVIEVTVSPSGSYVAYVLLVPVDINEGTGTFYRELHVLDMRSNITIPLITGKASISSIDWVPDQDAVSFRQSTDATHGLQVFSISIASKDITQLTDFSSSVLAYQFRGKDELLYTSLEMVSPDKKRLQKMNIDIKVFEEELQHIELHRYHFQLNVSFPVIIGKTVFDFTVSPDGSKVAAAIAGKNLTDDSYMFKRIHIIDVESGMTLKKLDNPGKLGTMKWCPDGKHLAFLGASDVHDAVSGSLFVMNTEIRNETFAQLTNLVQGLELSVTDVIWEDSGTLLYTSEVSTYTTLTRLYLKANKHEPVIPDNLAVFGQVQLHGTKIYFAGNTWQHPNELMHYDLKKKNITKLSEHNSQWLSKVKLAKQEVVSYRARDGKLIDGILVYPLDYKEGKRYPVIVYIHGGPEACVKHGWNNGYSQWGQYAATMGFFVFSPNYRASSGRGVDFTMVGFGDLAGVEYNDVIDGIDYLIGKGMADKSLIGIGGGSYGGYFAALSATRNSERFAAAVVFVGISNQVSKRKTTDIPYEDYLVHWGFWSHENQEKVWDASPMKYITNNRTPTLILHGESDPRIPVSQGMELYRGLKLHGKAPVRMVLYPGEGHGNQKNINRMDYLIRTLNWFDYYLNQKPGSKEMPDRYIDYPIH